MQKLVYDAAMFGTALKGAIFAILLFPLSALSAELVMVEQAGCEWCKVWNEEIAPTYPLTREGKIAPLRRVNIHDTLPHDLKFIRGLVYTPTFVLVHDGREVGRILGYPGEDFFWGLLTKLIAKLPARKEPPIRANGASEPMATRG